MGKLFNIALESDQTIKANSVKPEEQSDSPEELSTVVTSLENEIEQQDEVIEDAIEVREALEEDIVENETKIEENPESITEEDVIRTVENNSYYLGNLRMPIDQFNQQRITLEDSSTPVQKLKIATESMKVALEGISDKIANWTNINKVNPAKLKTKYTIDTLSAINRLKSIKDRISKYKKIMVTKPDLMNIVNTANNGKSGVIPYCNLIDEMANIRSGLVVKSLTKLLDSSKSDLFQSVGIVRFFNQARDVIVKDLKISKFEEDLITATTDYLSDAIIEAVDNNMANSLLFIAQVSSDKARIFNIKYNIKDGFWNKLLNLHLYTQIFVRLIRTFGLAVFTKRIVRKATYNNLGYSSAQEAVKDIDRVIKLVQNYDKWKNNIISNYEKVYADLKNQFSGNSDIEQFFYDFSLQSRREVNYKLLNYITFIKEFTTYVDSIQEA